MSEDTKTTPSSAAVVPPVKLASSRPAPAVAPQKSKARVWFKDPKTGERKEAV